MSNGIQKFVRKLMCIRIKSVCIGEKFDARSLRSSFDESPSLWHGVEIDIRFSHIVQPSKIQPPLSAFRFVTPSNNFFKFHFFQTFDHIHV